MSVIRSHTDNVAQQTLQGADSVKFIKLLGLRWHEHITRMNNEGKLKQVVTGRMGGTRERSLKVD
jgi:hypothetical protein